ncbi:MAG TPA: alpha/beta hydrolase [Chloroflexota bacterium]
MANSDEYEVDVRDVEYQRQGGKSWLARIYQPQGVGPFPSMIDIHGGAWHNGDRMNNVEIDGALAARGILVAALDFRQPPADDGYPASVSDVNLGVRWLKAHAAELCGTTSVGVIGNSSGGHLAVLSALRPHDSRYAALPLASHPDIDARLSYVVACWPVIDPLFRYRFAQQNNRQELVSAHLEYWVTEEAMAEGNPQTAIEHDTQIDMPPMLFILKKDDKNHPQEMQERFIASYHQRGGPLDMQMFDGLPEHRWADAAELPEAIRAVDTITEFVQRHSLAPASA